MHWIFEPGFFSSHPVQTALVLGAAVAVVCGVTGVFTVLQGQSFGAHSLSDVAATGGSAAYVAGFNPLLGFLAATALGAGTMEAIGVRRVRGRDLATGTVLGAAIGLAALFLYLGTTSSATSSASQQVLFGSIFTVDPGITPVVAVCGVVAVVLMALVGRPLLLAAISPEVAASKGVPLRAVGLAYAAALALCAGLASLAVGAILATALLVGPAAAALRFSRRLGWSIAVAVALGVGCTWLGILLAYDSYYWGSSHTGLPVSFFVVAAVLGSYLLSGLALRRGS